MASSRTAPAPKRSTRAGGRNGDSAVTSEGRDRMNATYDAVVIGTGFGGAVSASRLAQAGLAVGVFARGRRYPMASFPRTWRNPLAGWLWTHEQGLFYVQAMSEMLGVQ